MTRDTIELSNTIYKLQKQYPGYIGVVAAKYRNVAWEVARKDLGLMLYNCVEVLLDNDIDILDLLNDYPILIDYTPSNILTQEVLLYVKLL